MPGNLVIFKAISTSFLDKVKKQAIVSVINDLVSDNRVRKTCETIVANGYELLLIGREFRHSPPVPQDWKYRSRRMKMLFTSGPLFYLFFNLRLFFQLLVRPGDLLFANDLDTLLPNYLVSKIKKIPLIYDSHELFCEVPELQQTPIKKAMWAWLERKIVPRLKFCITVNNSIAQIFAKKYRVQFQVVRNIPDALPGFSKSRAELSLPENKKIVLLQGAGINVDRGAEELIQAMLLLENVLLLIIGSGDVWQKLEKMTAELDLDEKVKLIKRVDRATLSAYTRVADLGVSIDKKNNLNYTYSLPNKLFDYISAGLPVLVSRLPEIENIVHTYKIGEFIDSHEPAHIAAKIKEMLNSAELSRYRINALAAAKDLTWECENKVLEELIVRAGTSPGSHNK